MKKQKKTNHISISQQKVNWPAETQRIINWIRDTGVMAVYIDLFCGFGGTTSGVEKAEHEGKKMGQVILGINHDDIALACHRAHNPYTLHLREDVRRVKLQPIAEMVAEIRKTFPWIKVFLWCSAECTHHSKAKGGDSRDPDSRSLAEELFRYEEAIKPDVIQVENVIEFRSWGPLQQKVISMHKRPGKIWKYRKKTTFGVLVSKNKNTWVNPKNGLAFKKDKKRGVVPWMVPIPERKAEYFDQWKGQLASSGYTYQDKDINAADHGAYTARNRYYGQFTRTVPVMWPEATHTKDPEKLFARTGKQLLKHNPVRDVLDFDDTGDSLFTPGRIKSNQTFVRITEGGIKFIAGGKKKYQKRKAEYEAWMQGGNTPQESKPEGQDDFLIKYNSSSPKKGDQHHSVIGLDSPAPTVVGRNMIAKTHPEFLPFIVQFNNNCNFNSVDEPSKVLTKKDKFSLAFIQQRHNGNPGSKVYSTDKPARTVTSTGGNQELVQVEQILPYISNYHGHGHNCSSVDEPAPVVPSADTGALIIPEPFIFRQFTNGGQSKSINEAAGSILQYPKMNIVSPSWIMDTSFKNVGRSVNDPAKTMLAGRHHAYIVNPSYFGHSSSIDNPSPVVVARQDKAPLHLAQVEYGDQQYYGIVIYKTDSKEVKELKLFMAIYGIVDIKMRMLKEMELLPIQGFPADYIEKVRAMGIKVTGTDAKKYIGNSQEVTTAKCLLEAYGPELWNLKEQYFKNAA